MPRQYTVNPGSGLYTAATTQWNNALVFMDDEINDYIATRNDIELQKLWRDQSPLLNQMVEFAERMLRAQ